jgi:hypothetical protein
VTEEEEEEVEAGVQSWQPPPSHQRHFTYRILVLFCHLISHS